MATEPVSKLSLEEYLAIERASETRHEFVDGEMFAMSGGTMEHSTLQVNILSELQHHLQGTRCRVHGSEFRIQVSESMSTYPDASVVCGEVRLADGHRDSYLNPMVIVEILSPSTEAYDRGLKFQHYRTVESLREYVLVNQKSIGVERFSRQPDGTWVLRAYQSLEEELRLESIGVAVPLRLIYDRVEIPGA